MENKKGIILGEIKKYFIYFVLFSIIGWLYEVFLELFIYNNGFVNRGFLFGPYCPVYGFGAIIFILALNKLKKKKICVGKLNITPALVFVGIVAISTIVELITSYILQIFTGGWLWDYADYAFNFEGRIALDTSLRFGVGGMLFMYVLHPLFEKMLNKLGNKKVNILFISLFSIILIDFGVKVIGMI